MKIKSEKIFILSVFIIFAICFLVLSDNVLAGGAGASFDVTSAAPNVQKANLTYPWSGMSDPSAFINLIFQLSLGVAGASAFGVLIYGSVLWTVSGSISTKQDAIEWIKGAIWGLVLLLGSYLLLYTINPELVKLKTPDELMAPVNIDVLASFRAENPSGTGLSDDIVRAELAQLGVRTKSVCPVGVAVGCVDLVGMKQQTVDEIALLAHQVGPELVYVTGGTEGCSGDTSSIHVAGEAGHCGGNKFDLKIYSQLTSYINNNFQKISDAPLKYVNPASGAIYTLEATAAYGSHWDIQVQPQKS